MVPRLVASSSRVIPIPVSVTWRAPASSSTCGVGVVGERGGDVALFNLLML